jgi:hypothetical protein
VGGSWFKASPGEKLGRPYLKEQVGCGGTHCNPSGKQVDHTKAKRTVDVVQVLEHLPNKCEGLSSNPSTVERERERGKKK